MNLLLLPIVAVVGGVATILVVPVRRAWGTWLGLAAAAASAILALSITSDDSVSIGGTALAGSDLLRLFGFGWALGILVLGSLELASGRRRLVTGPALLGLGAGALSLAIDDPATSFAVLAGAGVAAVLVTTLFGWAHEGSDPWRMRTAVRGAWAVIGSGLLGIAIVAWAASPIGPLGNAAPTATDGTRAAASLALLAMVGAVALRAGLIPAHVWAARFIEGVSPLTVPAALVWGPAVFTLVALNWAQVAVGPATTGIVERDLVIVVGIASVLLGGLAAIMHDDLEHVLGYSLLQDAGVAVLAFASLHTEAAEAARDWLLASAMLKTALAAWVAGMRSTFGAHRLADLRGWLRAAPVLAAAMGLIAIGAIGLPGMALFAARVTLVNGVLGGIPGALLLLAALTPVAYLGRIILAGLGPPSAAVAAAPSPRPRWSGGRTAGWSALAARQVVRAIPSELRANRAPLVAAGVLLLAAFGFGFAVGGVGG